jgi:pyruvate/2-oxoglutarate dehydrogenase complex dihydrolipoamide acyltransferase (E2) component
MTLLRFRVPDLGEGVAETEIVRWLVGAGDTLTEDGPMVEVMTDKATVEIPAPVSGTVVSVLVQEGEVVPVGTELLEIETAGGGSVAAPVNVRQAPASKAAVPAPTSTPSAGGERVQATPLVRKLAQELGVDLSTVAGTGPGGRITDGDVRSAAGGATDTSTDTPGVSRIPVRGMRRAIADHLTSAQTIPTVTVVEELDLTALEARKQDSGIGYLPWLAAATCEVLAKHPALNATYDATGGHIHRHEAVHMGIAVQTDDGLVVPVVKDCHTLSAEQLDARIKELSDGVRAGRIPPEELRGGTFTVTSAGKFGGLFTTPLLNAPEVAILGLHRADDRAVVRDGEVVVRRMANLSISFDHRALDGVQASAFLLDLIALLQG